jgi:hypothetical protein
MSDYKTQSDLYIELCNKGVKVKNPLDDAALICVDDNSVEVYRILGHGYDQRKVYPNGNIEYLNR